VDSADVRFSVRSQIPLLAHHCHRKGQELREK
jgi:hypothetical protein